MNEQNNTNINLVYWASSKIIFCDLLAERCDQNNVRLNFIPVSHHASWFTQNRSILKNVFHLSKIFIQAIMVSLFSHVCVFGTNACRILFPFSFMFKNIVLVYNEMPCVNKNKALYYYDRLIFKYCGNVYLSSNARIDYVRKVYRLSKKIHLLENITVDGFLINEDINKSAKFVFCGSISKNRFTQSEINKLRRLVNSTNSLIDVYGKISQEMPSDFYDIISYKGELPHEDMLKKLCEYEYGILSYSTENINNDFCAPIKIFEYISCGCKILSVNKNKGLVEIEQSHPSLISFVDDLSMEKHDNIARKKEQETYLKKALDTNISLVNNLFDDLN